MSLNKKGLSCAFCKAYLFEDDDVVHCPVCGAPHHRECYNKLNHCALESLHGTEDEYDADKIVIPEESDEPFESEPKKESTVKCQVCKKDYDGSLPQCPHCSAPDFSKFSGGFIQFDLLGGVPADYKLDEDVTAEEAKKFVVSNTHRYIPKFARLTPKNRISWNWLAFLFPSSWIFARKMYKAGTITALLTMIATFLNYPLTKTLYTMGIPDTSNYGELILWMTERMPEIDTAILAIALFASLLNLGIRIFSALFGDYIYKNYVISTIKNIKQNEEDINFAFRKKGGVNFILFFIVTMALQYIPSIIVMFL